MTHSALGLAVKLSRNSVITVYNLTVRLVNEAIVHNGRQLSNIMANSAFHPHGVD